LPILGFFLSNKVHPQALLGRAHQPEAWNLDQYPIATGYLSDLDLFSTLLKTTIGDPKAPQKERLTLLNQHIRNSWLLASTAVQERYHKVPMFKSDSAGWDFLEGEGSKTLQVVLQKEGDLVLIPPGCWHQVYHLEPSVAFASQQFCEFDKHTVFKHIASQCCSKETEFDAFITEMQDPSIEKLPPSDQVQYFLKRALEHKFGESYGLQMWHNAQQR
jgi:hypothetical protein